MTQTIIFDRNTVAPMVKIVSEKLETNEDTFVFYFRALQLLHEMICSHEITGSDKVQLEIQAREIADLMNRQIPHLNHAHQGPTFATTALKQVAAIVRFIEMTVINC